MLGQLSPRSNQSKIVDIDDLEARWVGLCCQKNSTLEGCGIPHKCERRPVSSTAGPRGRRISASPTVSSGRPGHDTYGQYVPCLANTMRQTRSAKRFNTRLSGPPTESANAKMPTSHVTTELKVLAPLRIVSTISRNLYLSPAAGDLVSAGSLSHMSWLRGFCPRLRLLLLTGDPSANASRRVLSRAVSGGPG